MPSWVCQWKPFWLPVGESFKKAFLEEWVFVGGDFLTNRMFWISLCSTTLTTLIAYVMIILQHPDHRDSPILFLGNLRGLKIRPIFGNELTHHCLLHGHGPNATLFIHDNSVPFLNATNCLFQMMKSCAATKMLSPQEQIILLRGSR